MREHESGNLAVWLREHRLAAGLTQEALAERAGLSRRGIADLERGARRAPYPDTLRRLAAALGLSEADIRDLRLTSSRVRRTAEVVVRQRPQPRALPRHLTSFVGRDAEVAELTGVLETARLVTLTGPGGIGKTRLALALAANRVADSVALVELSSLTDPDRLPSVVAAALGLQETARGGEQWIEALTRALSDYSGLLVLDNCEHLVEACAALASALVAACGGLRILTTSREPLGVAGELVWSVPPLGVPTANDAVSSSDELLQSAAVRLFVDRARAVNLAATWSPTPEDARDLAEICRRLEGIPLAIELAAARVSVLSLQQILDRLRDPLRLLVGAPRTAPPRQQTLRATLEWSYNLLAAPEQRLLDKLSVFAGGWTLEAVERVCTEEDEEVLPGPVLDRLEALVRCSVVLAEPSDDAMRYRMLEPVRQFATERLEQQKEADRVGERHTAFFTALAEQAATALVGPDEAEWLARLEREHDNLRAALGRLIRAGDGVGARRLAGALYRFWFARGHFAEGRTLLTQVLALPGPDEPTQARAACWLGLDLLAVAQGDWVAGRAAAEAARREWQALGDGGQEALALRQLGILSLIRGETDVARSLLEAGLAQARAAGNRVSEALNLWGLAQVAAHQDAFAEAHRAAEAALACLAEVGWRRGAVNVLGFLGDLSYWLADYPTARTQLEQCLALARDVGAEPLYCSALVRLGQVSIEMHDAGRAAALLEESLRASTRLGDRESLAAALAACAQLAAATGDAQRALRLASAAGALRTGPTVGGPISAVRTRAPAGEQAGRLAHARAMLGERAASRARVEGQALSWEAAAAEATAVCRSVGLLNGRHGTGPL